MPAKSKSQARFMGMVAGGKKKVKGLSKDKAKEFVEGQDTSKLPEKKKKKSKKKVTKKEGLNSEY